MKDADGNSIGPSFVYGIVWYAAYCVADFVAVRLREPGQALLYTFAMSLPKWILIAPAAFIVGMVVGGVAGVILSRLEASPLPARFIALVVPGLLPGIVWLLLSHRVNVARMDWDPPHFDTLSRVGPALAASLVASIAVAGMLAPRRDDDGVA